MFVSTAYKLVVATTGFDVAEVCPLSEPPPPPPPPPQAVKIPPRTMTTRGNAWSLVL